LLRLSSVEPGFRTEGIVALFMVREPQPEAADQFLRDVMDELRNTPGVNGAAAVMAGVPTNVGMIQAPIEVDGQEMRASLQAASANYHAFMGIPIIRGRDISSLDTQEAPRVVVINETLSRSAFRGSDPIGRIVTLSDQDYEVIGVAADRKNAGVRAPTQPEFVISIHQWLAPAATVLIDYPYDELPGWRGALQEVVWRVNPSQAITQTIVLADDLANQTKAQQFFATATAIFAGLALCLALSGVNSVVSSLQQQRRREIGLRLALGAKSRDSRRLIYRDALRIVLPGLVIAALLVVPVGIFLPRSLFAVTELDMFAFFAAAAFVLSLGSAIATLWPAVTAGRIEPMAALRYE
jgi:ABC-type antimicrobial peptide transport system permease subunit